MALELYRDKHHACLMFTDLIEEDGQAVQANQFLITEGEHSALIDPGGALLYNPLVLALGRDVRPHQIELLLCSHQDPDIIGSVDKWLLYTRASVVCSSSASICVRVSATAAWAWVSSTWLSRPAVTRSWVSLRCSWRCSSARTATSRCATSRASAT